VAPAKFREAAQPGDNPPMNATRGILLFGHGARNPEWARPFQRIREAILTREPGLPVELGFLELMRPDFAEGIAALVAQGAREIVVVPVFIAGGLHVGKDLPVLAAAAMDRHVGVNIRLAAPLGESDAVLTAIADYARGA
jgi:sirohydrochlorin cobaltochelatase